MHEVKPVMLQTKTQLVRVEFGERGKLTGYSRKLKRYNTTRLQKISMILSNRRFELEMRGTARADGKATCFLCIKRSARKAITAEMSHADHGIHCKI
jgi:hypothetical protein